LSHFYRRDADPSATVGPASAQCLGLQHTTECTNFQRLRKK